MSEHRQVVDSAYAAAVYRCLERLVTSAAAKIVADTATDSGGDAGTEKSVLHGQQLIASWLAAHSTSGQANPLPETAAEALLAQLRAAARQEVRLVQAEVPIVGSVDDAREQLSAALRERETLREELAETAALLADSQSALSRTLRGLGRPHQCADAADPNPPQADGPERLRAHCQTLRAKLQLDESQVLRATYTAAKVDRLGGIAARLNSERDALLAEIADLRELAARYQAAEQLPEFQRLLAAHKELGKSAQLLRFSLGLEADS